MVASSQSLLTKKLWRELTDIKLLNEKNNLDQGKFFYESSPFDYSEDALPGDCIKRIIVGRLWLTSKIYQNHALRIEIRLPASYPMQQPEIVLVTPIYHPNANENSE